MVAHKLVQQGSPQVLQALSAERLAGGEGGASAGVRAWLRNIRAAWRPVGRDARTGNPIYDLSAVGDSDEGGGERAGEEFEMELAALVAPYAGFLDAKAAFHGRFTAFENNYSLRPQRTQEVGGGMASMATIDAAEALLRILSHVVHTLEILLASLRRYRTATPEEAGGEEALGMIELKIMAALPLLREADLLYDIAGYTLVGVARTADRALAATAPELTRLRRGAGLFSRLHKELRDVFRRARGEIRLTGLEPPVLSRTAPDVLGLLAGRVPRRPAATAAQVQQLAITQQQQGEQQQRQKQAQQRWLQQQAAQALQASQVNQAAQAAAQSSAAPAIKLRADLHTERPRSADLLDLRSPMGPPMAPRQQAQQQQAQQQQQWQPQVQQAQPQVQFQPQPQVQQQRGAMPWLPAPAGDTRRQRSASVTLPPSAQQVLAGGQLSQLTQRVADHQLTTSPPAPPLPTPHLPPPPPTQHRQAPSQTAPQAVLQRAQQLAQQQQQPAQQQVFTAPPQWEPFASNGSPPAAAVGRRKSHSFSVSSPDRSGAGPAGWQTFSPLPKPPLPPAARAQAPAPVVARPAVPMPTSSQAAVPASPAMAIPARPAAGAPMVPAVCPPMAPALRQQRQAPALPAHMMAAQHKRSYSGSSAEDIMARAAQGLLEDIDDSQRLARAWMGGGPAGVGEALGGRAMRMSPPKASRSVLAAAAVTAPAPVLPPAVMRTPSMNEQRSMEQQRRAAEATQVAAEQQLLTELHKHMNEQNLDAEWATAFYQTSPKPSVAIPTEQSSAMGTFVVHDSVNELGQPIEGRRHRSSSLCDPALLMPLPPEYQIAFGELQIGKTIGRGAFGDVVFAKYRGQDVAMKRLQGVSLSGRDSAVLDDFLREVHTLLQVRHPNIVQFKGACTEPPELGIVMEHCEHGSLFHVLRRLRGRVSLSLALKWATDIARGVNHLHSLDPPIIHRDIKFVT